MSKITKVKIKQPDGNFSESIEFGASASNITLQDGTDLETKIQDINNAGYIKETEFNEYKTTTDDKINQIETKVTTIYRPMGSVDTYDDLTSKQATAEVGDVWDVLDTGKNYAWTAQSTWDDLGGNIDLSNYYIKEETYNQTEIDNKIEDAKGIDIPTIEISMSDMTETTGTGTGLAGLSKYYTISPEKSAELYTFINLEVEKGNKAIFINLDNNVLLYSISSLSGIAIILYGGIDFSQNNSLENRVYIIMKDESSISAIMLPFDILYSEYADTKYLKKEHLNINDFTDFNDLRFIPDGIYSYDEEYRSSRPNNKPAVPDKHGGMLITLSIGMDSEEVAPANYKTQFYINPDYIFKRSIFTYRSSWDAVTSSQDITFEEWEQLYPIDIEQVTVEDNLTSTSTTNALSANQGKILNEKIPTNTNQLTNGAEFIKMEEATDADTAWGLSQSNTDVLYYWVG